MAEMSTDPLLGLLHEQGMIDEMRIEEIADEQARSGKSTFQLLQDNGVMDEGALLQVIADYMGAEVVNLSDYEVTPELLEQIPADTAKAYKCFPVALYGSTLQVAVADPLNPSILDDLGFVVQSEIQFVVASPAQIIKAIDANYGGSGGSKGGNDNVGVTTGVADMLSELSAELAGKGSDEDFDSEIEGGAILVSENDEDYEDAVPIVKFVNLVLAQAIKDRASDIHFEPFEDMFRIRYRVDGSLYEMSPPPLNLAMPVISRLKVMANLNISERRVPQDGRIALSLGGRQVDLRVSTLPTRFGESVVLRVLDRSALGLELENLGMPEKILEYTKEALEQPNGIFVVTGPTGCGKTTTLYSGLKRINTMEIKMLTAEDPVEFDIEGIMQVPINESVGMTFMEALKSFLRQDPDVIMLGEMRDLETAQIAVQASLTGHLVLSTLHTNDAPGAVTRLVDMGVEPFLISSSLTAALAQRLVRSVCKGCKAEFEPTDQQLENMGIQPSEVAGKKFYYGKGCPACNRTGYKGRTGIYELLRVEEPIRELINDRAPTTVIKNKAIELGMIPLRQDGLRNIFLGNTSVEEVLKYT
jgi:type IV pilus assembly protein PilB